MVEGLDGAEVGPRVSKTTTRRLMKSSLLTPDAMYSLSSPPLNEIVRYFAICK